MLLREMIARWYNASPLLFVTMGFAFLATPFVIRKQNKDLERAVSSDPEHVRRRQQQWHDAPRPARMEMSIQDHRLGILQRDVLGGNDDAHWWLAMRGKIVGWNPGSTKDFNLKPTKNSPLGIYNLPHMTKEALAIDKDYEAR